MPKAEHAHSILRRRVFTAICGIALFGVLPRRARAKDTELQSLLDRYMQLQDALTRHIRATDTDEGPCAGEIAVTNGFIDRQIDTMIRLAETPATNTSGLAVKAKVIQVQLGSGLID